MWVQLVIAIIMIVVSLLIAPKIKKAKPEAATDLDDPTAEAGRPIPVTFGTITTKGVNVLWFGEKAVNEYEV